MANFFDILKQPPVPFGKQYPLFTRISIETSGTCTRACWHCPAEERGKKPRIMTDALYQKILDELAEVKFAGVVQFFYVNEPLLDKNCIGRIAKLRKACPRCTIHVTSNWDTEHKKNLQSQLLTIVALYEAGVNSLNLNDYDLRGYDGLLPYAPQFGATVGDHNWTKLGPRKRIFSVSPPPTDLHSWSGYNEATTKAKGHCARPHRHIVIMWNGKVPICCAVNPSSTEILGDVNESRILDVWNSLRFFQYRQALQNAERRDACEGCVASVAFPHVVRRVTTPKKPRP
jgi:MoaA/NifB/PqqE/SkfB family radical SAM enzyme